ncbi:unnamed protein product [Brassica rapa]|uniref:Uncharacterized protein n=1 Tax=Brassica campestris TaxID=3711 RepID=A0A8D9HQP7_BRACM|nr:unnamed protein product [Brassica rapa]
MSGSSKKTLSDNVSAPNLRLEARLGVELLQKEVFLVEMIDSISVLLRRTFRSYDTSLPILDSENTICVRSALSFSPIC